jgi:hypothetical protein
MTELFLQKYYRLSRLLLQMVMAYTVDAVKQCMHDLPWGKKNPAGRGRHMPIFADELKAMIFFSCHGRN